VLLSGTCCLAQSIAISRTHSGEFGGWTETRRSGGDSFA
jgi:hypothetical protein